MEDFIDVRLQAFPFLFVRSGMCIFLFCDKMFHPVGKATLCHPSLIFLEKNFDVQNYSLTVFEVHWLQNAYL